MTSKHSEVGVSTRRKKTEEEEIVTYRHEPALTPNTSTTTLCS